MGGGKDEGNGEWEAEEGERGKKEGGGGFLLSKDCTSLSSRRPKCLAQSRLCCMLIHTTAPATQPAVLALATLSRAKGSVFKGAAGHRTIPFSQALDAALGDSSQKTLVTEFKGWGQNGRAQNITASLHGDVRSWA